MDDLAHLAGLTESEILASLKTSRKGLSESEARARRERFGRNVIKAEHRARPVMMFLSQFRSPLVLLLVAAAAISGFLGSAISAAAIIVIVLTSAVINFVNSYRSLRAVIALTSRVTVNALVTRDGAAKEIRVGEVMPGDIVGLEAGDIVPADALLLEARDFFLDESTLTGESLPAEHDESKDRAIRMGTSVVSGNGLAAVVSTGKNTEMGRITAKLGAPEEPTEFEKNFRDFSAFIFRVAITLILAIILVNIVLGGKGLLDIFLFAVAIAVGLTPELLPVIVATNLAKGARRLAAGGVIVKRLPSIHNLGSIDVLATDKTGTLTEDKITLVKHVDATGRDNAEVLFWGFLSVAYVTTVRNALDHAISAFAGRGEGKLDVSEWEKIDELPFDFARRRDSLVVHSKKEKKTVMIVKGAPEEILRESKHYAKDGEALRDETRRLAHEEYARLSSDGFRVLAVAIKTVPLKREPYTRDEESAMTFLGFLAFLDPPKRAVASVLKRMSAYHVTVKIITGDNELVSQKIARELDFTVSRAVSGEEIAKLSPEELARRAEEANLFTRVTPEQKELVIKALRSKGHVVGYMGDGVNDVLSLKAADVGISVNNAVDVAKETADIILLRKGLHEVIEGVIEGRKTFANTFKYLMMALSSNFGNMFSMPVASIFLPFLPMTAPQILLNNLLYDSSQLAIPFDHVDDEFLQTAKKFDVRFLRKFMIIFGPLSSCFDFVTFGVLFFAFRFMAPAFQTGWFLESIATQTLVVNVIRTRKSILGSRASLLILASSVGATFAALLLTRGFAAAIFGFSAVSGATLLAIAAIVFVYLVAVEFVKRWFYARWGYLIEK